MSDDPDIYAIRRRARFIGRGSHVVAIDRAEAGIAGSVADSSNVIATE